MVGKMIAAARQKKWKNKMIAKMIALKWSRLVPKQTETEMIAMRNTLFPKCKYDVTGVHIVSARLILEVHRFKHGRYRSYKCLLSGNTAQSPKYQSGKVILWVAILGHHSNWTIKGMLTVVINSHGTRILIFCLQKNAPSNNRQNDRAWAKKIWKKQSLYQN